MKEDQIFWLLELTDPRAMGPLGLVLFLSLLSAVHNSIIHSIGLIKPLELEAGSQLCQLIDY